MHGAAFHLELARLRSEFNQLQKEHARRRTRTEAEERNHLRRLDRWIADVETFRRMYLVHPDP